LHSNQPLERVKIQMYVEEAKNPNNFPPTRCSGFTHIKTLLSQPQ
jgi:hypothetical protein